MIEEEFEDEFRLGIPCIKEAKIAEKVMNSMRLFALTAGQLCDYSPEMSPQEYIQLISIARNDLTVFAQHLRKVLSAVTDNQIDWYRVVSSVELIVPRAFLQMAILRARVDLNTGEKEATVLFSRLKDIHSTVSAVKYPVKGLALQQVFINEFFPLDALDTIPLRREQTVNLLLDVFVECNKLWVRMKYENFIPEVGSLEEQRGVMQSVIIQPIKAVSKMQDLNEEDYQDEILPTILQHLVACDDSMAQEIISGFILDAFPTRYHLDTVDSLLDAVSQFSLEVDIRMMISTVINKILAESKNESCDSPSMQFGDKFDELWDRVSKLLRRRMGDGLEDVLLLTFPLLHCSLGMRPFLVDRVERILEFAYLSVASSPKGEETQRTIEPSFLVSRVIDLVVGNIPNASFLFVIPSFVQMLHALCGATGRSAAMVVLTRLVKDNIKLQAKSQEFQIVLRLVDILLSEENTVVGAVDWEDVSENCRKHQSSSRMLCEHLLGDNDEGLLALFGFLAENCNSPFHFIYLEGVITHLASSDSPFMDPVRQQVAILRDKMLKILHFTLSKAQFNELESEVKSALFYFAPDALPHAIIHFYCKIIEAGPRRSSHPVDALLVPLAVYESFTEAFLVYEDFLTDHNVQMSALMELISCVPPCTVCLEPTEIVSIYSQLFSYSKKLLRSQDKLDVLFALLQAGLETGQHLEDGIFLEVALTVDRILSKTIDDEKKFADPVRFCQYLIRRIALTCPAGDDKVIITLAFDYIGRIQAIASQSPIREKAIRGDVDTLLAEWQELDVEPDLEGQFERLGQLRERGRSISKPPSKEVLKMNTGQIAAAAASPAVAEFAVTGADDAELGQVQIAFATLNPNFINDDGFH